MNKDKLKEVAGELEKASKMHAGQAKKIKSMLKYKKPSGFKMKGYTYPGTSPMLKKISAGCKAAAKRKFDVYPSAYANMWASAQGKKGKC